MAIQFRCSQCGEPIEVDDEHANQTASCPYCRHLVTVPLASTYRPTQAIVARPADGQGVQPGGWPSDAGGPSQAPVTRVLSDRQQAARTFDTYALICTGLMVLAFGAMMVRAGVVMYGNETLPIGGQPSPEQMEAAQLKIARDGWVMGLMLGTFLLALAGIALGIASLVQQKQDNWRGLLAVIFCGLLVVCVCGGEVFVRMLGLALGV